ncbi:response regulator transcription factor [Paenibacillus arenilitoris]|uniref:Response regulator n=1 Tax=Paenibacillus arenilitoris TaxID=2772299 RepID=A0A927CRR9_9BACL|nr:response regulator [Paenibacillus arenilitoris]MBD2871957.1 response regulator [Paenibacillus arenilitoris]
MHLLVVDDEPVIRKGISRMAEQYVPAFDKVTLAENGQAALERIRAMEPDIVLTDIRMPRMDGLELCRILQEEYPHIKTVVISGYSDFGYAQKCVDYGVKHYLLKPVTKLDVHEVLARLASKKPAGYMAPSRFVEWIDRMEQHIWSLQTDELATMSGDWREYCLSANLSLAQLKELLHDCGEMLLKRFQARNFAPRPNRYYLGAGSVKEAVDAFEQELCGIRDELASMRGGNFRDPMEEAKAYIDGRLSEEITLEQVASMVGLTPTYFSSLFKKMTNETFVKYRIQKRIDRSKELLAVPHYRIIDIASEVGYDDYPHFTKTFKKLVGVTPSEFRAALGIK